MNALVFETIKQLCRSKSSRAVLAVDGMCASGKTTLAEEIRAAFGGCIIHADSFFLPPEMRSPERLHEPGGNFDRERFSKEVIAKLRSDESFEYGVFDCSACKITRREKVPENGLIIIEGSYCMHPALNADYDLKIFSAVSPETQLARICAREGKEALENFKTKWIVYENRYFEHFNIRQSCDITIIS